MKKNISINISGIIFHIEEDGYERLSNYLGSIQNYFSHYEDSKEILEDIESRIAEIFLSKLSEEKQVITADDVGALITTMGTIADFEATIDVDDEDLAKEPAGEKSSAGEEREKTSSHSGKRLTRDRKRRVLGGVAAGLAHYFNIDAIWVRLIFIALFVNFFVGGLTGAVLLAYIILWIVLPEDSIEEDTKVKKLYRDPQDRVLGGVASGLAAYFGTDKSVIRLLFVLTIFLGGSGFIIYLILWIITPEAQTITEKMQMQGEPVTLSNIESNIKESLNVKEGEENVFVKILLFPFRLIAMVINALAKVLGPLFKFSIDILRIFVGAILFIIGLGFSITLIVSLATYFGISAEWSELVRMGDIPEPFVTLRGMIPDSAAIFGFLSGIIPALILIISGLSIMANKMMIKGYAIWSFLGIWLIGLVGLAITVPSTINSYKSEGYKKETTTYQLEESKVAYLKLNQLDNDYSNIDLKLRGHDKEEFKMLVEYSARGRNREQARENASMVTYEMVQDDSVFTFDSDYTILDKDDFEFRFQEVDVIFYIPYNRVFKMDQQLDEVLINTLYLNGYSAYQIGGNDWVFTEEGITCLTCTTESRDREKYIPGSDRRDFDLEKYSGEQVTYKYADFDQIKANGLFEIKVVQADSFDVKVVGPRHVMDDVDIFELNGKLIFDYDGDWNLWKRRSRYSKVGVVISMPELTDVDLDGASKLYIEKFEGKKLSVDAGGASFFQGNLSLNELIVDMNGASIITVRGTAQSVKADISGASSFEAEHFEAEYMDVEASGASRASVYATREMEIDASGASRVKYSGTENVDVSESGGSTVRRINM